MSTCIDRSRGERALSHKVTLFALAVMVSTLGLSACSVVHKLKSAVHKIHTDVHTVEGNKAIIDGFNTKLSGAATTFEATYVTTGSAPATIVYAEQSPKGVAFDDTPTGGSGDTTPVHLVVNASGEYACSQSSASGGGSSGQWSCQKLGTADAATQNQLFDLYTPAHWVGFLKGFALAAGFAGDSVTSSTFTFNGFNMNCVDLQAPGVPGLSLICLTSKGILGYVKIASESTIFELQKYSTSPPASLFELPPGAKVTTGGSSTP